VVAVQYALNVGGLAADKLKRNSFYGSVRTVLCMTEGYCSDADGSEVVMDSPVATLTVDPSEISREQALELAHIGDPYDEAAVRNAAEDQTYDHGMIESIDFHFTLEQAVMVLQFIGTIDDSNNEDLEADA